MTDEQFNAVFHGLDLLDYQKDALRWRINGLLSASIADTAGAKAVGGEWRALFNSTRSPETNFEQFCEWMREEIAAPPAPSVADVKCMCSGLGPCEKLSNCRKAPSVADAAGAKTTLNFDGTVDITCAHCGGNGCFACLRKESGK